MADTPNQFVSLATVMRKALAGPRPPDPEIVAFEATTTTPRAVLRVRREDDVWSEASDEDKRAIVEAIRRQRLWSTGDQMEFDRVVASIDDRMFDFSWREWGALLSRAWCGTDEHYTIFAWGSRPSMAAPPDVVSVPCPASDF